jgi:hypothetical protein
MSKSRFTTREIESARRSTIREREVQIGRHPYVPPDEDDLADQMEYIREHMEGQ